MFNFIIGHNLRLSVNFLFLFNINVSLKLMQMRITQHLWNFDADSCLLIGQGAAVQGSHWLKYWIWTLILHCPLVTARFIMNTAFIGVRNRGNKIKIQFWAHQKLENICLFFLYSNKISVESLDALLAESVDCSWPVLR